MKQISLEIELSKLKMMEGRHVRLEQYTTPPNVAAMLLYRALADGNIEDKVVADLGCGNGILAIGAAMLGAGKVHAVEKDPSAIEVAKENSKMLGTPIEFLTGDVKEFKCSVDTIVMNPPFGSQNRGADVPFIEVALKYSKNFYILLNYKAGDFLERITEGKGDICWDEKVEIPIAHQYDFHRKERKMIEVRMARVRVW